MTTIKKPCPNCEKIGPGHAIRLDVDDMCVVCHKHFEGLRKPIDIKTLSASGWGRRKYKPGRLLTSLDEVCQANDNGRWLYWHGVPKHPSIIVNMSLGTVTRALRDFHLRWAEPNEVRR